MKNDNDIWDLDGIDYKAFSKLDEKSEIIKDQSDIIDDQREIIKDQSKIIKDQSRIIRKQNELIGHISDKKDLLLKVVNQKLLNANPSEN